MDAAQPIPNPYRSIKFRDGSIMLQIPGHGWKVYSAEKRRELIDALKAIK